jgi:HrpA-like RNA helicase
MPIKKMDDPADVVVINARCFKVTEYYIDDIIDNLLKENEKKRITLTLQDRELLMEARETQSSYLKANVKESAMRVATLVICEIIQKLNSFDEVGEEKASVLIFLPGMAEIFAFIEYMGEFYDKLWMKQHLELIPLHSSLNEEEQDRAFKSVAKMEGRRKVIVSTNLAESSITIPDVKYVIDFMLTKEVHYDPASRSESLQLTWCSRANAT